MTTTLSTKLYFTHGIEIENHLVSRKADGEVLVGENLIRAWEKMFEGAAEYLKRISRDKKTPKEISKRIVKVEVREELKRERRLKFVFVTYRLDKKNIPINVFGPDPNIGQITWLLELVTPPCQYLEEMEWWIETLYMAALYGLKDNPDVALLPIGLNPTEKRVRSGLTCGEHHHIGIPKHLIIPVYNLLRNFIPHMIAISASSPFLNQTIGGKVLIRNSNGEMERKQIIGRCTHSYRLLKNSGQMGPNIPNYLPVLDENASRPDFSRMVKKSPPDDRMVDLFPFTDYSTIELRFFDAQPWPENRLAIVLLIQAIAKKAASLTEQSQNIPAVSSPVLYNSRRKAVQFGLLAQFDGDPKLDPEFARYYNWDILNGNRASKLIHSFTSLLIYVKDELQTFGPVYTAP
ncbi:MAG: glutamate-cysteine ligase family protein, partial [Candidatus Heimdallarchaeota archaeon]